MSIEVRKVTAGYQSDKPILNSISMRAEKSKITCIIGPNGAGKSTLLKTIYGFLKPQKGTIVFDEEEITNIAPYVLLPKGLAYIPQHFGIFHSLTVRENLKMGGWTFRDNQARIRESIDEVFERFPILKTREKVLAGKLSGGEQRMLDLGRALMSSPKALMVDEPTAGLAPKIAGRMYKNLEDIAREGKTVLMVDQNVKKAVEISEYIYVLQLGQVTHEGPEEQLGKQSKSLIKSWLV